MLVLAAAMLSSAAGAQAQSWSVYGGDDAGTRYSAATEITKANVAKLRVAWTYHTGDAVRHGAAFRIPAMQLSRRTAVVDVTSLFTALLSLWNQHPEHSGSRRATPLRLFQHQSGQFRVMGRTVKRRFASLWSVVGFACTRVDAGEGG
jgi:hypothetical protein